MWLIKNKTDWVSSKLDLAYELAKGDDDPLVVSVCELVCDHLAELLKEGLETIEDDIGELGWGVEGESLSMNLLHVAFGRISFGLVAEAIMRHKKVVSRQWPASRMFVIGNASQSVFDQVKKVRNLISSSLMVRNDF